MTFMSEYSPLPGTVRSYEERVEFDEPCTRNRTGSGCSPGLGAPTRLRHRLSLTSPLFAQYSALQIAPSAACAAAAPVVCACADARPQTRPAPMPRPAPRRMVRRAGSAGSEFCVMASFLVPPVCPAVGATLPDRRGGQVGRPAISGGPPGPAKRQALAPDREFCYSLATS